MWATPSGARHCEGTGEEPGAPWRHPRTREQYSGALAPALSDVRLPGPRSPPGGPWPGVDCDCNTTARPAQLEPKYLVPCVQGHRTAGQMLTSVSITARPDPSLRQLPAPWGRSDGASVRSVLRPQLSPGRSYKEMNTLSGAGSRPSLEGRLCGARSQLFGDHSLQPSYWHLARPHLLPSDPGCEPAFKRQPRDPSPRLYERTGSWGAVCGRASVEIWEMKSQEPERAQVSPPA